jgi:hypothetical protein
MAKSTMSSLAPVGGRLKHSASPPLVMTAHQQRDADHQFADEMLVLSTAIMNVLSAFMA